MTTKTNNAEGGAAAGGEGTIATVANTGSGSGTAFTTITPTTGGTAGGQPFFSALNPFDGTWHYRITCASGLASKFNLTGLNASLLGTAEVAMCWSVNPSQTNDIVQVVNSSGSGMATIRLTSANKFQARDNAGAQIGSDSTLAVQPNTYYRFEPRPTGGTTTSNGSVTIDVYEGNSPVSFWNVTIAGTGNTGTANYAGLVAGKLTASTWTPTLDLDAFSSSDGTTAAFGPVARTSGGPVADVTIANWTPSAGSTAYPLLRDSSDATFITSQSNPTSQVFEDYVDRLTAAEGIVTVRARRSDDSTSGSIMVRLMEGATERAAWGPQTITTSPATYTFNTTSTQRSSITDLTNVRVRVEMTVT